tara:strand:+ start:455 stop:586 length:132 start_codon:yes stop_codon:yes gene_type:complete
MTLLDRLHRAEEFLKIPLSPKTLTQQEIKQKLKYIRETFKIII